MKSRIMAAISCLLGRPTMYGIDYRRIECYCIPRLFNAQARRRNDGERMYVSGANSPSGVVETITLDADSSREVWRSMDRAFEAMDSAFASMDRSLKKDRLSTTPA